MSCVFQHGFRVGAALLPALCLHLAAAQAQEQLMRSVRGVLRSANEATLATDTSLRILEIPFRAGQAFAKGDLLVAFDCERLEGERLMAEAEARGAQATHDNASRLHEQRAAGALEVAVAKAEADKAAAALLVATIRLKPCKQLAPFSGRVVDVLVHEHDMPAVNSPLIRIVDTSNIEVDLIAPSSWLRWLKPTTPFSFTIDETGQEVSGTVARLGAVIDPISQTVRIVGQLDLEAARAGSVIPGMSGTAVFGPTS